MVDYNQQIKELEDELKKTKYNKATQGHVGIVKAKIAQLRENRIPELSKRPADPTTAILSANPEMEQFCF